MSKNEEPETMLDFTKDLDNFDGIQSVPAGEYTLKAEFAELKEGTSSKGNDYRILNVRYSVVGEPAAANIYHSVFLPMADSTEEQRIRALDGLKKFLDAHSLPGAFSTDDIQGIQVDAILGEEEYEGTSRNKIKRFVSGR